jgi:hypothetical protein
MTKGSDMANDVAHGFFTFVEAADSPKETFSASVVRAAAVTRAAPARSFGVQPLNRVAARGSAMPRGPLSEGESQHREAQRQDEARHASLEPKHDHARGAGHEPVAEQAAGPSSGTALDAAVQRTAPTDDVGASLEPKHDHARGAGHEPLAEQAAGPSFGTAHDAAVQRAVLQINKNNKVICDLLLMRASRFWTRRPAATASSPRRLSWISSSFRRGRSGDPRQPAAPLA